jgi:hypothetical protein
LWTESACRRAMAPARASFMPTMPLPRQRQPARSRHSVHYRASGPCSTLFQVSRAVLSYVQPPPPFRLPIDAARSSARRCFCPFGGSVFCSRARRRFCSTLLPAPGICDWRSPQQSAKGRVAGSRHSRAAAAATTLIFETICETRCSASKSAIFACVWPTALRRWIVPRPESTSCLEHVRSSARETHGASLKPSTRACDHDSPNSTDTSCVSNTTATSCGRRGSTGARHVDGG